MEMDEQARAKAVDELREIVARYLTEAARFPRPQDQAAMLELARRSEEPLQDAQRNFGLPVSRHVVFARAEDTAALIVELYLVGRLSGSGREITQRGDAIFRAIEARHGGVVPLSQQEFDALADDRAEEVLELARRPESGLHPLLCQDDAEMNPLSRHWRTDGNGR